MSDYRPLLLMCATLPVASLAAQEVANPGYISWAQWKEGAKVEYKSLTTMSGRETESTITYALVEVTDHKAVVEMRVSGTGMAIPPRRMNIPAKFDPVDPTVDPYEGMEIEKSEGTEPLDVGGRVLATRWTQLVVIKYADGSSGGTTKTWTSPEVPGELVKKTESGPAGTTEMILVSIEAEPK